MDDQNTSQSKVPEQSQSPEINFFGVTNFRNQNRKFGIKLDDRRRHVYVVGKTGMGKTTLLENMVLNDIYAGHGVGLVDPHGDFAEKIIDYIPSNRINDVVYFNPADIDYPIGFNIMEVVKDEYRHLVASGLMAVFKKIWPDVWSPRMEYILNNTILALLDTPGTTLLGINRMLADEDYRNRIVKNSKDPVVKAFWTTEFEGYTDRYKQEAVPAIQNKIGQFLSASVIRNIVAQVKSRIDIREIMDNRKIFIMNLSKGRIGEDNMRLLGGMLVNRLQIAAMERVDIPEKDRKDFFLYVDEFQNFATESFANILSEARKYRLGLTMAHQYMEQLDEKVLAAVIGNVGTMMTFRVGSTDAEILAKEFIPTFTEEDLVNLPKFQIYLKLMIDGIASHPFSATTLGPIAASTDSTEKVVRVCRERYAVPREKIENKIMRWSGMGPGDDSDDDDLPIDVGKPVPKETPKQPGDRPTGDRPKDRQDQKGQGQPRPAKPQSNQGQNLSKRKSDQPERRREDRREEERLKKNIPTVQNSASTDANQKVADLRSAKPGENKGVLRQENKKEPKNNLPIKAPAQQENESKIFSPPTAKQQMTETKADAKKVESPLGEQSAKLGSQASVAKPEAEEALQITKNNPGQTQTAAPKQEPTVPQAKVENKPLVAETISQNVLPQEEKLERKRTAGQGEPTKSALQSGEVKPEVKISQKNDPPEQVSQGQVESRLNKEVEVVAERVKDDDLEEKLSKFVRELDKKIENIAKESALKPESQENQASSQAPLEKDDKEQFPPKADPPLADIKSDDDPKQVQPGQVVKLE